MIGVLASFAVDGRSRVALRRAREYEAAGVPFLWDSGAWSVFTGAAKVGVADHTAWIKAFGESSARFVGLDVIGDAAATLANYRDQRAEGVNVEPTLHYGEPLDQIDDLLAPGDIEWFNVGGIVGALTRPSEHRNVAAFIAAVRRRLPPEVRIHALGCIHPDIVRLVSVDAADSTYWLNVARFRSLSLFDAPRADWRKFSVCTTTRDARRDHTWRTAYEAGSWLRAEYDLDPVRDRRSSPRRCDRVASALRRMGRGHPSAPGHGLPGRGCPIDRRRWRTPRGGIRVTLGILVSYADVIDGQASDPRSQRVEAVADEGHPLVWDSGAFSVFTGNADITPEQHGEWVLAQPQSDNRRFIGLDVIGDPAATLANYRTQREMGAVVEPTIHYGDPLDQVDRLLDVAATEYLNVGGLVPYLRGSRNLRNVAAFIAAVRLRAPNVRIHALGCTNPSVLRAVYADAVDSSSWLTAARYRKVFLFDATRARWRLYLLKSNTAALRAETWNAAYRDAQWLRTEYGVAPSDLVDRANDLHFVLSLTIRWGRQVRRLHRRSAWPPGHDVPGWQRPLGHRTLRRRPEPGSGHTHHPGGTCMTTHHTLAVVSGGMDSTTLAHLAAADGPVTILSFDYGQRHAVELSYAARTAEQLEATHIVVPMPWLAEMIAGTSALVTPDVAVPEGHYAEETMRATVVPNRNAVMLNIAAAVAIAHGCTRIGTGVHAGDHAVYPDCRPEFIDALNAQLSVANEGFLPDGWVGVWAPFVDIPKDAIATIGEQLGVPWPETWSCYNGGTVHCGSCSTCFERREAFDLAGIADPTDYLSTPMYEAP